MVSFQNVKLDLQNGVPSCTLSESANFLFNNSRKYFIDMKLFFCLCFLFLFGHSQRIIGQELHSKDILQKSIQYHDPQGNWEKGQFLFPIYESRPNGNYRLTDVKLDNYHRTFELSQIRAKDRVYRFLSSDSCEVQWNYQKEINQENQKKLRLHCNGGNDFFRNYYAYLYGLPMKLKDPGAIIGEKAKITEFFGQQLLEIRVTYSPEVGEDIWYFYFHPETYALSGYRFYHDEQKNDGEYILLKGEVIINQVKFPKERAWYTHKEGKYLGNDDLLPYPATKF